MVLQTFDKLNKLKFRGWEGVYRENNVDIK
jgi:hypothetical protein